MNTTILSLLKKARIATMSAFVFLLNGCSSYECGQYKKYVEDDQKYNELIGWADSHVFSRTFEKGDLASGRLSGVGRSGAFAIDRIDLQVPEFFRSFEFRPLGPDPLNPDGIFIGSSSFRGLIVAKSSIEETYKASKFSAEVGDLRRERIVLTCYQEK